MTTKDMLPCRFCGGTEAYVYISDMCRHDNYHVCCDQCEYCGPAFKEDKAKAIEGWNAEYSHPPVLRPGTKVLYEAGYLNISSIIEIKELKFGTLKDAYEILITDVTGKVWDCEVMYLHEIKE